jgi:hypothetical protein
VRIVIELIEGVPATEFSDVFVKGMADRMSVSYFKYGPVAEAYPSRVDAIATLRGCLEKYERTGNTEYLMDAANYAMIEFLRPRHPKAHFKASDSKGSPGRVWHGETDPSQLPNDIRKHNK